MGLFGSLFEKKECAICGGEIGLLGNRKLEDGNMCKNCAKKLSPWFSDRRSSTVEEIKEQLAYREENRKKAAQFRTTKSFGEDKKVLLDETHLWFTVTSARDLAEANPDILDFSALTGCQMDIDESRSELKREDKDGKRVSYVPPRYEYSYDFEITIHVNHPYFDEMKFRLNSSSVDIPWQPMAQISILGQRITSDRQDPMNNYEYRKYKEMGDELCGALREIRSVLDAGAKMQQISAEKGSLSLEDIARSYGYDPAMFAESRTAASAAAPIAPVSAAPAAGPWTCPSCGAQNKDGKFCEFCGAKR